MDRGGWFDIIAVVISGLAALGVYLAKPTFITAARAVELRATVSELRDEIKNLREEKKQLIAERDNLKWDNDRLYRRIALVENGNRRNGNGQS